MFNMKLQDLYTKYFIINTEDTDYKTKYKTCLTNDFFIECTYSRNNFIMFYI